MLAYKESYNDTESIYQFEKECKNRKEKQRGKKKEVVYFIKQKLSGLVFAIISILLPMLTDGDGTASLLLLPLGLYLIFTKEKIMDFKGK